MEVLLGFKILTLDKIALETTFKLYVIGFLNRKK